MSKHWNICVNKYVEYKKIVIYSHKWENMKQWLLSNTGKCSEYVIICNHKYYVTEEISLEFFCDVFQCLDANKVRKLILYDMKHVDLGDITRLFPKIEYVKLYRPCIITGENHGGSLKKILVEKSLGGTNLDDFVKKNNHIEVIVGA